MKSTSKNRYILCSRSIRTSAIVLVIVTFMSTILPMQQISGERDRRTSVAINEVELNPKGIDAYTNVVEWVELYNSSDLPVQIGGWKVTSSMLLARSSAITIPQGIIIPAKGFFLVYSGSHWLNDTKETITLLDEQGRAVDKVGPFSDLNNDGNTWQALPDGSDNWVFKWNTKQVYNESMNVVTISNLTVVDESGKPLSNPELNRPVFIESELKNNSPEQQDIVYIVQIKDNNGFTVSLSWLSYSLSKEQKFTAIQPWMPEANGCYTVAVSVWRSMTNPVVLSSEPLGSTICIG